MVIRLYLNNAVIVIQKEPVLVFRLQVRLLITGLPDRFQIISHLQRPAHRFREIPNDIRAHIQIHFRMQSPQKVFRCGLHDSRVILSLTFAPFLCPCLITVKGPQCGPVMVRAIIDLFLRMLTQNRVHIHIMPGANLLFHPFQKADLVIAGCICGQFIRENIVRCGNQHHIRIPRLHQFFQQRYLLNLLHQRIGLRKMPFYQIIVRPQIDTVDFLPAQRNIRAGLDRNPLLSAHKLICQILFIILCILSPEEGIPGKLRPGGKHLILCL